VIGAALLAAADEDEAAALAAVVVEAALRAALATAGSASLALSGGTTPWPAYRRLATSSLDWDAVTILQVDEREVAEDDPDRNLRGVREALGPAIAERVVPLEGPIESALARYGPLVQSGLDVVVLGIGEDGHTASLVPGDPVLTATAPVARTGSYRGHPRLTMTYPVLAAARSRVVLAHGASKHAALLGALDGQGPAGRIPGVGTVVVTTARTLGG